MQFNARRLFVCCLLIITMVPAVLSSLQVSAVCGREGGCKSHSGTHSGKNQPIKPTPTMLITQTDTDPTANMTNTNSTTSMVTSA